MVKALFPEIILTIFLLKLSQLQLVVNQLPPEMAEILQIDYRAYCTEVVFYHVSFISLGSNRQYFINIAQKVYFWF